MSTPVRAAHGDTCLRAAIGARVPRTRRLGVLTSEASPTAWRACPARGSDERTVDVTIGPGGAPTQDETPEADETPDATATGDDDDDGGGATIFIVIGVIAAVAVIGGGAFLFM